MADLLLDRTMVDKENQNMSLSKEGLVRRASLVKGQLEKNDLQWNTFKVLKFNLQRFIKSEWLCKCLRPKGRWTNMLMGY